MADDPSESVPDELEERLDDLSGTLTDDDMTTAGADQVSGLPAAEDADGGDADESDADLGDADADADDA